MDPKQIRYGPRRFWLALAFFAACGVGFIAWSQAIDGPTYVFPFGRLSPESARLVLLLVGIAGLLYAIVMNYVRFVRRPVVVLGEGEVSIPVGEFGASAVVLRTGDVLAVRIGDPRRGGWRTCHVDHRRGVLTVRSSQLPSDEAFVRICDALRPVRRSTSSLGSSSAMRSSNTMRSRSGNSLR